MLRQNDFNKIELYINGDADESEKEYVESLFLNGENNLYLRNCINKDWEVLLNNTSPSEVNLSHQLDKIHQTIRKNEALKRQKPLQKLIRIYMRTAAILLLPLLLAGVLVYGYLNADAKTKNDNNVNSTIYAPLGARVSFSLPDGTTGMLNSGSRLSYSLPFSSNRKISLEGEAWFEVKSDEDHPFEINVNNSTVKVFGTKLNINAYLLESYVEVVLQEGKVEFLDNNSHQKVNMLPAERLVLENGKTNKSFVDPSKYTSWTEGKLVFRNDRISEVARRIERWYNVKVELADSELEKYSFRATFEDDKLEDVLRFLSMTSPITYQITPGKLLVDGTYEKELVTINFKVLK